METTRELARWIAIEIAEAVGKNDLDAARGGVDERANIDSEWDEKFAGGRIDDEHGRAGDAFAWNFDIANDAEQVWCGVRRARRGGESRGLRRNFENAATFEVLNEINIFRKFYALIEGNLHIESTEFFRVVDGIATGKMKDGLAFMVLAEPAALDDSGARLAFSVGEVHFAQFSEPLGEIGEDQCGKLTFIPSGTKEACKGNPLGVGTGHVRENFLKEGAILP